MAVSPSLLHITTATTHSLFRHMATISSPIHATTIACLTSFPLCLLPTLPTLPAVYTLTQPLGYCTKATCTADETSVTVSATPTSPTNGRSEILLPTGWISRLLSPPLTWSRHPSTSPSSRMVLTATLRTTTSPCTRSIITIMHTITSVNNSNRASRSRQNWMPTSSIINSP